MLQRGRAVENGYGDAYRLQARYQAAEAGARSIDRHLWGTCGGPDTPLQSEPTPPPAPVEPAGDCASGYNPCLPSSPDLDCADVDGPVTVTGDDPHGLDADGDGVGCDT